MVQNLQFLSHTFWVLPQRSSLFQKSSNNVCFWLIWQALSFLSVYNLFIFHLWTGFHLIYWHTDWTFIWVAKSKEGISFPLSILQPTFKSRIREAMNLSTRVDSSTDTKDFFLQMSFVPCHVSGGPCNVSCVTCFEFHVTYHLSPVTWQ